MSANTPPTLTYVSSHDVSSMLSGTTSYTIIFDAANIENGNLIMFEYKLQDKNSISPNLDNTEFGFVSVENAIQNGLVNQYIVSVPASNTTNNTNPTQTIQIRVYFGKNSTNEVFVTEWSNELDMYLPPTTPVIFTSDNPNFDGSFFNNEENKLYVLLKESDNDFDYEEIKFIVCFFYQNSSNVTVWKVSEPTQATSSSIGNQNFKLITVDLEEEVLLNSNVYVSMHSVYDWVSEEKNYHSVSYMSNEVVSVPSSNDSDPNITSVVYNIYNEVAVPGDQTILVTWEPPGNSVLPFFQVQKYELYYKINSGEFTLYPGADDIDPNTLEYTVNVGASGYYGEGLDMKCGDSIVFRVDAVVQGVNKPSPESDSTNFFKYSEAVTDLTITDSSYDPTTGVGFTVNFTGVSDIGKGCGDGVNYVIKINGVITEPTGGDSLTYVPGKQYAVNFSNLSINQVGTVEVYLLTKDTNNPTNELAGLSETVPYIANNVTLNDVNYSIYTDLTNDSQSMVLSWSDPALPDWTVEDYVVQYNTGTSWEDADTTNSTTYAFDASTLAAGNSSINIKFRILANMKNGETSYVITSNEKSQYTFKFAEDVQEPIVNWSVANTDNTTMDINLQFKNPTDLGVNNGLQFFRVTVLDSDGGIVLDSAGLNSTQDVSYVFGANLYTVNFNDIDYSPNGTITIEPFVTDTNGRGDITSVNYEQDPGYTTSTVPLFTNLVHSNNEITGEIITHDLLKPTGLVVYPISSNNLEHKNFDTINGATGFVINNSLETNQEYKYTFTINVSQFFGTGPQVCDIIASNDAGVGLGRIILSLP